MRKWLFVLPALAAALVSAQAPTSQQKPETGSGMSTGQSTGAAAKAVYDAEHRPITAGGFVATGPVVFADISKQSGLAAWTHVIGDAG